MSVRFIRKFIPLIILLGLFTVAAVYLTSLTANEEGPLEVSGTVEAVEVVIVPEVSGKIVEVLVEEGDWVEEGDMLYRLDDESLLIQRQRILSTGEAAMATANLEWISAAQALDELFEKAAMSTAQAQWNLAMARQALDDAEYLWNVKQEGNRADREAIAAVEAKIVLADKEINRAKTNFDRFSGRSRDDPQRAAARARLAAARQERDALQRTLNWYLGKPDEIEQAVLDAEVAMAEAQVANSELEFEKVKNGPDPDAAELAEARLANAEAQYAAAKAQLEAELESTDLQLGKYMVRAPTRGVVTSCDVEVGEVVLVGGITLTIGQVDELTLTVYLSEDRYGEVSLGDQAIVAVDSFPDRTFDAVVQRIADEAEFTPRNVSTEEGRRTTVFAIELSVLDPDRLLKPGMPADVQFNSPGN